MPKKYMVQLSYKSQEEYDEVMKIMDDMQRILEAKSHSEMILRHFRQTLQSLARIMMEDENKEPEKPAIILCS